jgi:hypothetical protein
MDRLWRSTPGLRSSARADDEHPSGAGRRQQRGGNGGSQSHGERRLPLRQHRDAKRHSWAADLARRRTGSDGTTFARPNPGRKGLSHKGSATGHPPKGRAPLLRSGERCDDQEHSDQGVEAAEDQPEHRRLRVPASARSMTTDDAITAKDRRDAQGEERHTEDEPKDRHRPRSSHPAQHARRRAATAAWGPSHNEPVQFL